MNTELLMWQTVLGTLKTLTHLILFKKTLGIGIIIYFIDEKMKAQRNGNGDSSSTWKWKVAWSNIRSGFCWASLACHLLVCSSFRLGWFYTVCQRVPKYLEVLRDGGLKVVIVFGKECYNFSHYSSLLL